jgi:hypothetical protein
MMPESSEAGAPPKLQQTLCDNQNFQSNHLDTFSSKDYNLPVKTSTRKTRNVCSINVLQIIHRGFSKNLEYVLGNLPLARCFRQTNKGKERGEGNLRNVKLNNGKEIL